MEKQRKEEAHSNLKKNGQREAQIHARREARSVVYWQSLKPTATRRNSSLEENAERSVPEFRRSIIRFYVNASTAFT
jgi:hypothetical protein